MRESANSLARMLDLLTHFSDADAVLSMEQILARTGYQRSTAYRYVRELVNFGLLAPVAGRAFGLGPFVIELDRSMRLTDPLLIVAPPVMEKLSSAIGQPVLLGRYFRRNIVCVHQEGEARGFTATFGRGREMPRFASATSRAILAHLSTRELKDIYFEGSAAAQAAGLGDDWTQFRRSLSGIRRAGFAVSIIGSVDPGAVGIGAPVFDSRNTVVAGVTVVAPENTSETLRAQNVPLLITAAQDISNALRDRELAIGPDGSP